MMRYYVWVAVMGLCCASDATLLAQDTVPENQAGSQVAGDQVARYVDGSTVALAQIDLSKINVAATVKWMSELSPQAESEAELQQVTKFVAGQVESLMNSGVTSVYAVISTRSLVEGGPVIVAPCTNPIAVNATATLVLQGLPPEPVQTTHVGDGVVLLGPQAAIKRLLANEPSARGDLVDQLAAADRLSHIVTMSLPAEARGELQQLWPARMPNASPIQFSPRELVADIARVAVTWDSPPHPVVEVKIEAVDRQASERVKAVVDQAIALSPGFKQSFTVEADGTTVRVGSAAEQLAAMFKKVVAPARQQAERLSRMNDVKQVMLAFHNYVAKNNHFPPRCFVDKAQQPLYSWRTALLPYLDQQALYNAMKLDEAWDSERNQPLSQMVVPVLRAAIADTDEPWKTCFRAPVFPGSIWDGDGAPLKFRDVIDGTSNTIAVVLAPRTEAVVWSDPQPWVISKEDPMKDVFGDRDEVLVGMLDGAARVLKRAEMTNGKLAALLTRAGGEVVQ